MKFKNGRIGNQSGFSLIELLIVIAILGIIAAFAYPSYQESVRKTRRADAQSALLELAQLQERFFYENNSYATSATQLGKAADPFDSQEGFYSISVASGGTTYSLTATPQGGQASDGCGTLSYTNAGVKGRTGTVDPRDCW